MNRKLLLVIALVLIASCETKENSLDKSIIEPLTIEELRVEMEKDNMFQYSYNAVEKLRNETLTTDVLKAKYGNITYREVDQFYRYFKDTITFNNLERKFKDEWTKEYANVFSRVDSTVN